MRILILLTIFILISEFTYCQSNNEYKNNIDITREAELKERLMYQIPILNEISKKGKDAIPLLLSALTINSGLPDDYEWEARELLSQKYIEFPDEFNRIIKSFKDDKIRWYAIYAVRESMNSKCIDAIADVFNNINESKDIRLQCMLCLMNMEDISPQMVSKFEKGLKYFLSENTREEDIERAIELAEFGKLKNTIDELIMLLDKTKIYSYTQQNDKSIPNTLSDHAHKALKAITGLDLPPDKNKWNKIK